MVNCERCSKLGFDKCHCAKPSALDEFLATIAHVQKLARKLQKHADNHFDTDPDEVTWADVGDVKHIRELLEEVLDFVEGKE